MIQNRNLNVYAFSSKPQEYEVFRGLLNGKQVATLESSKLLDAVAERVKSGLGALGGRHYVLHDGCDIRKPNSKEMEHLGQVLSLSKQVISGYKTMNSVVVSPETQSVELLCHELYSNKMPNYIGEMVLNDETLRATLSAEQLAMVEEKTYINTKVLLFRNLEKSSRLLKEQCSANIVCHLLDREHDDEDTFREIAEERGDEFVIRSKHNRCSHQTYFPFTPSGKISKKAVNYKLIDKSFEHGSTYEIESIRIKGKTYKNVQAVIAWEALQLAEKTYNVVRITLTKAGKPLFAQPMLLITNRPVTNAEEAKGIYMAYLLRSKIEVVFKFLKQHLGWEAFQVRDFNSIKNLLALAFFLVGFFPELQTQLANHPTAQYLCDLARSKGKVTLYFLLKGLEKLAHFEEVQAWMTEYNITQDQIQEILTYVRT
ncbi:MAG TPA: transposase [Chitinophagales bacterium]|nr:transposase [Chitinophagales bacterium]